MNKSTAVPESTVGKWSEKKKETKNNYVTFIWTLVSEQSAEEGKLNQKNDVKESSLYMEEPFLNNVLLSDH